MEKISNLINIHRSQSLFGPHGLLVQRLLSKLALPENAATFSERGFPTFSNLRKMRLEAAGGAFVAGYNSALKTHDLIDLLIEAKEREQSLEGFFIEGSAMAFALKEAIPIRLDEKPQLCSFLDLCKEVHPYLATVGTGWALAKFPWRHETTLDLLEPALLSLAFDGWGFCDCFFDPRKTLAGPRPKMVRHYGELAARSWDRGAGRSLWFSTGGNPASALAKISDTEKKRHDDLIAGLGLAVTYTSGLSIDDARELRNAAGPNRRWLVQGAAFALEAHFRAGTDTRKTEEIFSTLSEATKQEALAAVAKHRPKLPSGTPLLVAFEAHELWRQALAEVLASA